VYHRRLIYFSFKPFREKLLQANASRVVADLTRQIFIISGECSAMKCLLSRRTHRHTHDKRDRGPRSTLTTKRRRKLIHEEQRRLIIQAKAAFSELTLSHLIRSTRLCAITSRRRRRAGIFREGRRARARAAHRKLHHWIRK
jgi:hypothetical protein